MKILYNVIRLVFRRIEDLVIIIMCTQVPALNWLHSYNLSSIFGTMQIH